MNDALTALWNGLHVAVTDWQLLLGILLIVALSQWLLYCVLKVIFGSKLSAAEYYSVSLAGWLLPACLISFLWYVFAMLFTPQAGTFLALTIAVLSTLILWLRVQDRDRISSRATVSFLLVLTLLFILLRLAFISKAVFPSYFDSAQHYLYIKVLLANLEPVSFTAASPSSFANYYHLGFHFLAAFITFVTGAQITGTMLMLGQIILGLMPFSIFLIIRHATGSAGAGIFAIVLASFGWYMPAHAMDWGKYPALASIALLPFVISIAYLVIKFRSSISRQNYWVLTIVLAAGMALTVILHSRSLIVFALLALTWFVTYAWQKLPALPKLLLLGLMIAIVIAEFIFIQTKGVLLLVFDPYASKGLPITIGVLFLSIFAYKPYPHLVFYCIFVTGLLLASLFIPLRDLIPGYANMTLLDRPFVEMILFLPLTFLGGFGLAGLKEKLQEQNITRRQIQVAANHINLFACALVVIHALFTYDLYPSDCCIIVTTDDVLALEWMNGNLPLDARVLTSSTELNVLPTNEYQGSAGGDAGAWVNPITGRTSVPMIFYTDFSDPATLDALCQLQVGYVYVGTTGWIFDDSTMPILPNGFRILLALPRAKVYEVTGCNP